MDVGLSCRSGCLQDIDRCNERPFVIRRMQIPVRIYYEDND